MVRLFNKTRKLCKTYLSVDNGFLLRNSLNLNSNACPIVVITS